MQVSITFDICQILGLHAKNLNQIIFFHPLSIVSGLVRKKDLWLAALISLKSDSPSVLEKEVNPFGLKLYSDCNRQNARSVAPIAFANFSGEINKIIYEQQQHLKNNITNRDLTPELPVPF